MSKLHFIFRLSSYKKFKLNATGEIVDAKGAPAFNDLGQLKPEAIDFWMPPGTDAATDADTVTSGGVANNLIPASRKLLIDSGSSLVNLNSSNVSNAKLGSPNMDSAEKTKLLEYIQGYAESGSSRNAIGDILHSKPTLISYGTKQVVFVGTNEGFLHAFDAADAANGGGVEKFAFMPSSLLKNIPGLYENAPVTGDGLKRIYGVDGNITAHINDINQNGKVDVSDGDTATLIFGLRRGGNEYYALDVTNPDSPSLKWKFSSSNLAETWSQAIPKRLRYLKGGAVIMADVLVFGGGYDNRLDEEVTSSRSSLAATKGNAVYIIDLATGELIWKYDGSQLQHSVPGNISSLDMDKDGSIDRLYFGDTGGNLWRVDLNAYDDKPGRKRYDIKRNSQLFHLADLGGTGADKRKFFFAPDISIFQEGGKERLLLSIGSGYRSHPLNTNITDRFYVLSDEDVRSVPSSSKAALTETNLVSADTLNGESFLRKHKGWYKPLTKDSGEKVLASPITFANKILFTTFAVTDQAGTTLNARGCPVPIPNQAHAYVLNILTGDASADLDNNGIVDARDESFTVPNSDILGTPQLFFNKPSNCANDGCNHNVDIRVGKKSTPLINKDTIGGNADLGEFLPKVFWLNKYE